MILVDIYIPAVDDVYDFMLDENAPIGEVKEEIYKLLCQKAKETEKESGESFYLWASEEKKLLPDHKTLRGCGVYDGARLIMV